MYYVYNGRCFIIRKDYIILDKKSVFIDKRAKIGKNVIIYENCRIEGVCEIEDNITIFPNCFILNSNIGKGTKLYSSIIESSNIGVCCSVGPYCHIKGTKMSEHVKVGDFSVLKYANIQKNKAISPFSYLFRQKEILKNKKDN